MLVSAAPLTAQRPGTIDIGVFGRFTRFDGTLPIDNDRVGAGGRLGIFALSQLAIESEASFTSSRLASGASVSAIPFRLRLAYHAPVSEKVALILGAGWVHDWYRGTLHESDNGVTGILGLRFGVVGALTFRVDGTSRLCRAPLQSGHRRSQRELRCTGRIGRSAWKRRPTRGAKTAIAMACQTPSTPAREARQERRSRAPGVRRTATRTGCPIRGTAACLRRLASRWM